TSAPHPPGHHRSLPSFPTRRSSDLSSSPLRSPYTHSGVTADSLAAGAFPSCLMILVRALRLGGGTTKVMSIRPGRAMAGSMRSQIGKHTSELQSPDHLVCRLLLEKK